MLLNTLHQPLAKTVRLPCSACICCHTTPHSSPLLLHILARLFCTHLRGMKSSYVGPAAHRPCMCVGMCAGVCASVCVGMCVGVCDGAARESAVDTVHAQPIATGS